MARPRTISNERILEAALAVFLERGYGATTSEIARRAEVSEGTLFKRFPTKEALFLSAIAPAGTPPWFATIDALAAEPGDDVRDDLQQVVDELLTFFETLVPRMSVLMASPFSPRDLMCRMDRHPVAGGIRKLTEWFDTEMRRGRLRMTDPEVVARILIGALKGYAFDEQMQVNEQMPMPRTTFLRGVIDVLLRGVVPGEVVGRDARKMSEHSQ